MIMMTHYEILDISKVATEQEIKRAYRSLALKFHPDRNKNPDAEEKFLNIQNAYETLICPTKRSQYDFSLNGTGNGNEGFVGFQFNEETVDINQIFGMLFNNANHPNKMQSQFFMQFQKPPPIIKTVRITLEQCFQGCSIPVEIDKWTMNIFSDEKEVMREVIYIDIPRGVDNNELLILRNMGHYLDENLIGDVKIVIEIENTAEFQKQGLDLVYQCKISLQESLCGFATQLIHVSGKSIQLRNSSIIQPNGVKIIPNLGFEGNNSIGNLIVKFEILFPTTLSELEKQELLKLDFLQ